MKIDLGTDALNISLNYLQETRTRHGSTVSVITPWNKCVRNQGTIIRLRVYYYKLISIVLFESLDT